MTTSAEMKSLAKAIVQELMQHKDRSAWDKGVTAYALEIIEWLDCNADYIDAIPATAAELETLLLNGAKDWTQYSYGANALAYDSDIAERLCTPSELKRTRHGERRPNAREDWIDTQARALCQASTRIKQIYDKLYRGGNNDLLQS